MVQLKELWSSSYGLNPTRNYYTTLPLQVLPVGSWYFQSVVLVSRFLDLSNNVSVKVSRCLQQNKSRMCDCTDINIQTLFRYTAADLDITHKKLVTCFPYLWSLCRQAHGRLVFTGY